MRLAGWLRKRVTRVRANIGRNQQRPRSPGGRIGTVAICVFAGLMMTIAAIAARGTDLRSDRYSDIRSLIVAQGQRNAELRFEAEQLGHQVEEFTGQAGDNGVAEQLTKAQLDASLAALSGPGLRVTLTDAPDDVRPAGVTDDELVVHQQDIQAVVNALWAGGAEAIAIQGQRVIATTGIKCVGNTVVLHGIPYAPPYRIEAIGDADRLRVALEAEPALIVYRQYVEAYGLGYTVELVDQLEVPAFGDTLKHATVGS